MYKEKVETFVKEEYRTTQNFRLQEHSTGALHDSSYHVTWINGYSQENYTGIKMVTNNLTVRKILQELKHQLGFLPKLAV